MKHHTPGEKSREAILSICDSIAHPDDVVAVAFYGPHISGYADEKTEENILLIKNSTGMTLRFDSRILDERKMTLCVVDKSIFEKDVREERLGGLIVENILTPYEPIVNGDYLWVQEVEAKRRIIVELLGNLVLEFPEMSNDLLIKPPYFLFESMSRKASLFPPIYFRFLNICRSPIKETNVESMMKGFISALELTCKENVTHFEDNGFVKAASNFMPRIQKKQRRIINIFKNVRSSMLRYAMMVFPTLMNSFIEEYRIYTAHHMTKKDSPWTFSSLEDSEKYVFTPTPMGLVSLSDKTNIQDFAKRVINDTYTPISDIRRLGGALNTVYELTFRRDSEEHKIVAKVFKDWYGWKWFPLALWTLGTREFAVLGKSRLEREYAINRFLSSQGLHVPRIIYLSLKERIIFQEFIEGVNLAKIIRQIDTPYETIDVHQILRKVGRELAKVHISNVSLGDCKPENFIVTSDKGIYFVDLEQAERGGDQAWDIAEFLYYSGHYMSFSPLTAVKAIVEEFVGGYLTGGGNAENVKKIGSPRYVKVFGFFTPPYLVLTISNMCREIVKTAENKKCR